MRKVNNDEKLFFYERHFFTLDGLWMIETENELNWESALKIDTIVWNKLLKTIIRRIKRYLKIETNSLKDLVEILSFRWSVEGWDYKISKNQHSEVYIEITNCPYKATMDRNPERYTKIKAICVDMCVPFYESVISEFNSEIEVSRTKFMSLGNETCDFKLSIDSTIPKELNLKKSTHLKREVSNEDKLFYFERNFFTLDGLWIIECENETDWKTALKIDVIVWQRLYQIIFRRVKRYLNIEGNNLKDLLEILSFTWSCEGYKYKVEKNDKKELIINITACPYKAAMDRNPDRHNRIKAICIDMCVPFYEPAIKDFNPKIKLKRSKFLGTGDKICNFHFMLEDGRV